ncbi:hypothetical protein ACROYT_G028842 [Oculina patagonica]
MNESKKETETHNKKTSEKERCSIATIEQALISNNIMEAEEAFAVRRWQGLRETVYSAGNISKPVEGVSPLDAHESSEGVATVETFHTSENNISKVTCDDGGRSNHSLAVTGSSAVNISMPNEKVSSLDAQESSEVVAAEDALSILDNEISEVSYDFGKGNDISLSVTGSSAINISMPMEKLSPLDVRRSSEDETLRERKRKRSCENCVDESVQLKNNYSVNEEQSEDFTEPFIKCRRLLSIGDSSIPANSSINMPAETGSSLDGEMSDQSLAVTGTPVSNISVPVVKVSSLDVHESSQGVATEEAFNLGENEINECSCAICKMSDTWLAVSRSFSHYISMPVEKVSSQDVQESSEAVATKDICNISENEISEVTCDNDGMSDHSLAMTGSPIANISMPIEKVSTPDERKSSEAVSTEDTGYICDNEISDFTCDNGEMSDHSLAVTGSSATNIRMPIEKASKLVVHELSEADATEEQEASGFDENEINECSGVICKMSDHCLAVSRSFARYISLPVEKISPQDKHESSEAVAAKQAGNIGENEFSEYSEVSSLDVHEAAEARNGRQRKRKGTSEKNVDESVSQSEDFIEPLRKYRRQCNVEEGAVLAGFKDELCDNEAVEKGNHQSDPNLVSASSKLPYGVYVDSEMATVPIVSKNELCGNEIVEEEKHQFDSKHVSASKLPYYVHVNSEQAAVSTVSNDELCGNESVEDNSHQSDSSRVSASSKLPYDVPVNPEEAAVSAVCKDELCGNEAVEEGKHQSDSKHVSASSKLPCDVLVNSGKMELNPVQNALAMCAKIKTKERPVSVGALASDVDTPDTIGYVRYYLRTAYQFLFGAMRQNPVGSVPLESDIHQPQELRTAQPSQSTRTRLGRVKRVWNVKAFVPEVDVYYKCAFQQYSTTGKDQTTTPGISCSVLYDYK